MDLFFDQSKRDIVLEGGDIKLIENQLDLLSQRLFLRFKTFSRELFWNTSYGIDYINRVFGRARPKTTVDALIKSEILNEPMVKEITSFSGSINNYYYGCSFTVTLKAEDTVVSYYLLQNENGLSLTDESGKILTARIT